MTIFRHLDDAEADEFRQWARDNYTPMAPILGVWHPAVQYECAKMNLEYSEATPIENIITASCEPSESNTVLVILDDVIPE